MAFVVAEAESRGYIDREDGRLRLTLDGMELFRSGSETPEIYEVEKRQEQFHFDLISFAPHRYGHLEEYQVHLPELGE